jgi:post-segregation antitoxin (ccd killing protein)
MPQDQPIAHPGEIVTLGIPTADPIRTAAREYHINVSALVTREITVDQHRAVNKRLRESFADPMDWERAKATVLGQLLGGQL